MARFHEPRADFIDDDRIEALIHTSAPDRGEVEEILAKSLSLTPLTVEETAALVRVTDPDTRAAIAQAAHELKERVYGKRIVLFAPLYVGNRCVNDCLYCGFRRSNRAARRVTLTDGELREQVRALERVGHKRLILVFGEHPDYSPEFVARVVETVYRTREERGEIRRVNINAAPLDLEGYRVVHDAGIGTYQIFQETYHHGTYARVHPEGTRKADYRWRLHGVSRAMEAGCDDVGIGALLGLYDWRFETLGLVAHARFLAREYGVGPHTISFPRLRPASGMALDRRAVVSDDDLAAMVAILRLAVPYTGLILTAREPAGLRRRLMALGVSQIDGGSRIDLGGYTSDRDPGARLDEEQFDLADTRSLDEVMAELLEDGYLPSFCTACYRLGRTGEHFMELAIPGFIERFCTPNALVTLTEYLEDYGSDRSRAAAEAVVARELGGLDPKVAKRVTSALERVRDGQRDLLF